MRNLFHRRGHNGRLTFSTIPTTRHERWRAQFDDGRGPYFYAAVVAASIGFYGVLWLAMALF
jgi:hypothetical protein